MQLEIPPAADIAEECKGSTPARILRAIAEHRAIAADALARVNEEGSVVRTLKGDVIAHPSIRIHADATKAEAALLAAWAKPQRPGGSA
jgi:hypothetical protein